MVIFQTEQSSIVDRSVCCRWTSATSSRAYKERWTLTAVNCMAKLVGRTSTVASIVNFVRPRTVAFSTLSAHVG